ncbi:MAG TPA: hypothetical protein VGR31_05110 [Planctomycetota bacterium]|nr:hypothetical protein [Planctomycetota bacterium]
MAPTPPPTPHEEPFSESHLDSPEYRERLMRKLNCLIAVLEVATAKVKKSLTSSPPDAPRLTRICANLESTLEVCQRARAALARREGSAPVGVKSARALPKALPPAPPDELAPQPKPEAKRKPDRRAKRGRASDVMTDAERRKFAALPPIDKAAVRRCNLDDLARRLCN